MLVAFKSADAKKIGSSETITSYGDFAPTYETSPGGGATVKIIAMVVYIHEVIGTNIQRTSSKIECMHGVLLLYICLTIYIMVCVT